MTNVDDLNRVTNDIFLNLNRCQTQQDYLTLCNSIRQNIVTVKSLINNSYNANIGTKRRLEGLLGKLLTFEELCLNKIEPTVGTGLLLQRDEEERQIDTLQWINSCSAFKSRIRTCLIVNKSGILDPGTFLEECKKLFILRIPEYLNPTAKINFILSCEYNMPQRQDVDPVIKTFQTRNFEISKETNMDVYFDEIKSDILNKMEIFEINGSGWSLSRILNLSVQINKYTPLSDDN